MAIATLHDGNKILIGSMKRGLTVLSDFNSGSVLKGSSRNGLTFSMTNSEYPIHVS